MLEKKQHVQKNRGRKAGCTGEQEALQTSYQKFPGTKAKLSWGKTLGTWEYREPEVQ